MQAINEEIEQNPGLIEKPIDGKDTLRCTSSYGLYDDCLTQKYIAILRLVLSYLYNRCNLTVAMSRLQMKEWQF